MPQRHAIRLVRAGGRTPADPIPLGRDRILHVTEVRPAAEVAPQMLWGTYSHVIRELTGSDRIDAAEAIRKARSEAAVPRSYPQAVAAGREA